MPNGNDFSLEELLAEKKRREALRVGGQPSVVAQEAGITGSGEIDSLLERALKRGDPSQNIFRNAMIPRVNLARRIAGEKPIDVLGEDDSSGLVNDLLKTALGERIKTQFSPQEGFKTQEEIPQESGGLPLKTVKYSKGRYVPEYGYSRPLVQFGGFDPTQFNTGEEPEGDVNESAIPIPQAEDSGEDFSEEQLEQFRQEAIAQGMTPEEIAEIDKTRTRTLQSKDIVPASSVIPTNEGIQAALAEGFTREEIDNFLKANRRQRGQ